jgi:uncharacterized protein (TIGR00290 family)
MNYMKEKVLLSWSGGKDSALALYELKKTASFEIAALLTTVTQDYERISMHGVRTALLEMQAQSLGLPLEKIYIRKDSTDQQYERAMQKVLTKYLSAGVKSVAFGDIFLEDLKEYREKNLKTIGMNGIFPIWKKDTAVLANMFIELKFKAIITCIDNKYLDKKYVGMKYDKQFLRSLPSGVDPCGENGEFHSFVYDGPIFNKRIPNNTGKVLLRENRFYFIDIVPFEEYTAAAITNPIRNMK